MKIHRILPTVTTTNTLTKPCAFIRSADPNAASVVETWHERNATVWVSMGCKMICHYETFFFTPHPADGHAQAWQPLASSKWGKTTVGSPTTGSVSPVVEQNVPHWVSCTLFQEGLSRQNYCEQHPLWGSHQTSRKHVHRHRCGTSSCKGVLSTGISHIADLQSFLDGGHIPHNRPMWKNLGSHFWKCHAPCWRSCASVDDGGPWVVCERPPRSWSWCSLPRSQTTSAFVPERKLGKRSLSWDPSSTKNPSPKACFGRASSGWPQDWRAAAPPARDTPAVTESLTKAIFKVRISRKRSHFVASGVCLAHFRYTPARRWGWPLWCQLPRPRLEPTGGSLGLAGYAGF